MAELQQKLAPGDVVQLAAALSQTVAERGLRGVVVAGAAAGVEQIAQRLGVVRIALPSIR